MQCTADLDQEGVVMNEGLVAALRTTKTRNDVEKMFTTFKVEDIKEKTDYLDKAMYADEVFYSCGNSDNTPDALLQRYYITLGMFIEGSWRIAELYDRLGLPESDI